MLNVVEGNTGYSGHTSLDGSALLEGGVFLQYEKADGQSVLIDGIRLYFVAEDELEMRDRAKETLNEVATVINRIIIHVRNGCPENELEYSVINNVRRELNHQSDIDEDWVVFNFRELHIEAHRLELG